jgi:hypothetical protein
MLTKNGARQFFRAIEDHCRSPSVVRARGVNWTPAACAKSSRSGLWRVAAGSRQNKSPGQLR